MCLELHYNNSCIMQSNTFGKSVSRGPKSTPWSEDSFQFFIMYKRQFGSTKSFTKTTLKFKEDLIYTLNIWSYINLSYILKNTDKKFTDLFLDLSSFSLFLKTGITSACFKQWESSPLTRDWLKFWNINLENMSFL